MAKEETPLERGIRLAWEMDNPDKVARRAARERRPETDERAKPVRATGHARPKE